MITTVHKECRKLETHQILVIFFTQKTGITRAKVCNHTNYVKEKFVFCTWRLNQG
jgi:hypothetical protein